ncbi:class I SAM-dependent methyltransferase [Vibrio sp. Of7-15]|uniref:class I SAM-dependent methyltransferase n=1 Tax=Vibrio sp. Of7-15 TaxID=2724879 RepID=UPI001EF382DF|nr:class I SAM-dependent methyltransferase [Vibrio sp. Of7-15]MCG7495321.1 class I SAM-dependent methyltransferase [Vibrio sp. Of7-15]
MHFLDRLNIRFYHDDRLKEWEGHHAKVLGWSSTESQQSRFNMIYQALNFERKSVLDLGCGYGDFKTFLDQRCQVAQYTGIDQQGSFIKQAKTLFSHQSNCRFFKADFSAVALPPADIVIASGSLNYRSRTKGYHPKLIKAMYRACHHAVAFNMLDSRYVSTGQLLAAHHPEEVLHFCRTLCPTTELLTNYSQEDFTIVMMKQVK